MSKLETRKKLLNILVDSFIRIYVTMCSNRNKWAK